MQGSQQPTANADHGGRITPRSSSLLFSCKSASLGQPFRLTSWPTFLPTSWPMLTCLDPPAETVARRDLSVFIALFGRAVEGSAEDAHHRPHRPVPTGRTGRPATPSSSRTCCSPRNCSTGSGQARSAPSSTAWPSDRTRTASALRIPEGRFAFAAVRADRLSHRRPVPTAYHPAGGRANSGSGCGGRTPPACSCPLSRPRIRVTVSCRHRIIRRPAADDFPGFLCSPRCRCETMPADVVSLDSRHGRDDHGRHPGPVQ